MPDFFVVVVGILVLVVLVAVLLGVSRSSSLLPVVPRRLMTSREREVLPLIEAAVPHCRVHAQVAMGALIDCRTGLTAKQRTAVRNRFDRKRIDFVLEERSTGDVLALVELDDRTHNAAKDRQRDSVTSAAGYKTVRLGSGKRWVTETVREEIEAALTGPEADLSKVPSSKKRRTAAA